MGRHRHDMTLLRLEFSNLKNLITSSLLTLIPDKLICGTVNFALRRGNHTRKCHTLKNLQADSAMRSSHGIRECGHSEEAISLTKT